MKNYYYKIINLFQIIGILIIIGFSIYLKTQFNVDTKFILIMALTLITIYSCICLIIKILVKEKILIPMSKMLNSPKELNSDVYQVLSHFREKLKEATIEKNKTDTILKHMTDGVIAFDMDGKISYINEAAQKMLNIKNEQNFNNIFEKFNDKDINLEKIIYLNSLTSTEKKIDNNNQNLELVFVPVTDETSRPTGLLVVIQDITEHVKLDTMRKEFVANVSHELKTPLTSIKGFSETLLEENCDKKSLKRFLGIINDNANRMEQLVQDLLTLSKYNSQTVVDKIEVFDIGILTKKCKEKFDVEIKKKNLDVSCFVNANKPIVKAGKSGIERVILNIISNAIKYTKENCKIDIVVGTLHNQVYVKVKDNGIGIPKEDLKNIFDRFYRVDKARTREMGGTGLGLSIAKTIIEQNGGNIKVSSELGKGTEFTIILKKYFEKEGKNG